MDTSKNNLYEEFKRLYQTDLTYKQIKQQLNITSYKLELYVNKLKSEGINTKREKQQAIKERGNLFAKK
jgi:DNA-binding transcriptional regulator LsrR (DeoR family)